MATIHKFEFDLSFDKRPEPTAAAIVPDEPVPPPPPSFSQDELDAARKAAWAEGFHEGEAQAKALDERRLAAAAEQLASEMARYASAEHIAIECSERRAAAITLATIRKLFPALAARDNLAEIEAMLTGIFTESVEYSRISVHCSPPMADVIGGLLEEAISRISFAGRVAVVPDPSFAPEDCRISWGEGGVERLPRQLLARIEETILSGLGCGELATDLDDDSAPDAGSALHTDADAWHGQEIDEPTKISAVEESAPLEDVA